MESNLPIQSFDKIYERLSMIDPHNAVIYILKSDVGAQIQLMRHLHELGQHQFVNLVTEPNQARIVMCMFKGDGEVIKITPSTYFTPYQYNPYVLPECHKHMFTLKAPQNGYGDIQLVVETYPFIPKRNVSGHHVDIMRKQLDAIGWRFNPNDDKVDNVRILCDGRVAIIDGDAIRPKNGVNPLDCKEISLEWDRQVRALYAEYYADINLHPQTDHTNFTLEAPPATIILAEPPNLPDRDGFVSRIRRQVRQIFKE